MGIQVLGPIVLDGNERLGPRDRVVLAALTVRSDETVDKAVLADALYGETPPVSWPKVVQGCIARLRKLLGPGAIETTPYGYRLVVHEVELDARRFERLLDRARGHLADGDADRASFLLAEALGLWRGNALPDLVEWEPGRQEAERLDALRMDAQELRIEAEIAAGRSRGALEDARTLVKDAPFREHRWCLLATALYQSGRQTDALEVVASARRLLREQLGLDPGPELLALEQAILRQDPELSGRAHVPAQVQCPYRGLLPFDATDADSFFGRDANVAACLRRLRDTGVLAVVGRSGVGKSSVVRAGVVATLLREGVPVVVTTPGTRPLDTLAVLPSHGTPPVLVVDQAEEAITMCADPAERAAYFERLETYGGPLVLALRADRLADLSSYPGVARILEKGLFLLGPMNEADLRAAIEGPARHAGLRTEPGLVDLLVREVEGEPGALPLLSHALRQTWGRREGSTLTVQGYRETGGIRDAVAQSAEQLYAGLDERQRGQVRSLFLRLVTPGEEGEATRARISRETLVLDHAHDELIERLVNARLLSSDDTDVQVAHEALAREWPRLREWLRDDVEGQRTFRHLAAAAEAWEGMGRPDSELYRGVRLAGAVDWAERHDADLAPRERAFLAASRSRAEREQNEAREQLRAQRRSNRRLRFSLAGIAGLLVAALVIGIVAVRAEQRASEQATAADTAARVADSRRLSAQALVTTEPDVSLLLGVESIHRDDSQASRSTLYSVLEKTSQVIGVARGPERLETVDVSPDGRSLVAASQQAGGLLTFDASTFEATGVREDLGSSGAQFSPDGRHLLVAAAVLDDTGHYSAGSAPLQLLDPASLRTVGTFEGLRPGTYLGAGVRFSADGSRITGVAFDDYNAVEALVWDVDRLQQPILRVPMRGILGTSSLSPDGAMLFLAERDKDMRAVDVRTGRVAFTRAPRFAGEREPAVAVSNDGETVATSDVDGIALRSSRDLRTRFVLSADTEAVTALAFTSDGSRLAAGYADGTAVVWDVARRKPLDTLKGHDQEVTSLRFGTDASTLFTSSSDSRVLAWDLVGSRGFPPWRRYPANPSSRNPHVAIPSPDGKRVAYLAYGAPLNQLTFRDLETGRLTRTQTLPQTSPPAPLGIWSPDSSRFVTGGGETKLPDLGVTHTHVLQSWDPRSGALVRQRLDARVLNAAFTPDGKVVAEVEGSKLQRFDAETLEPEGPAIDLGSTSGDFLFIEPTPDGKVVLAGGFDANEVQLVDLAANATTRTSLKAAPYVVGLSVDGKKLAVFDNTNRWGVLLTESLENSKPRWSLPPREFTGNSPWYIFWSADGSQIITTGTGVVDLWQSKTLTRLGNLSAVAKEEVPIVRTFAGSPSVLIAHPHGEVLSWDLRPQHVIDLACSLAGRNLTRQEWATYVGSRPYAETCPSG